MEKNNIPYRLKKLRTDANLSQSELGDAIGFTKQAISDIESGRRSTTSEKLIRIANYFNISIDYLVGREIQPRSFLPPLGGIEDDIDPELRDLYKNLNEINKGALIERARILLELQNEDTVSSNEKTFKKSL